jgi:5-formyltetrahydrofolate cyclo-ligase
MSLIDDKRALRLRMRALRRALPAEQRAERSHALCARLLALPSVQEATTVIGYRAMSNEADLTWLLEQCMSLGKTVAVPRVEDATTLSLRALSKDTVWQTNALGIVEPNADAARIDDALHMPCVVLVPGLAFDRNGHRLGYGKGYYDRLLSRIPAAQTVGVGFAFQLIDAVPHEAHDVALNGVVTDTEACWRESFVR